MASVIKGFRSQSIGTTPVVVGGYTAATHTSGTLISGLTVANVLAGPTIVVTVQIKNGATVTNWVVTAVVMQGGALKVADEDTRHALNNGDQVLVSANLPSACDAIMTVVEIDT